MSKATIKETEVVVLVKQTQIKKNIVLELSEIEALILQGILYSVSGDSTTSIRKYTDNISKSLDNVGCKPSLSSINIFEEFIRARPDSAKIFEDLQNGKS